MKRTLSLITLIALCLVCASACAESGNSLGLQLLAALWDGKSNCFVSPLCLETALAMTAGGAAGETREELLSAIGAEQDAPVLPSVSDQFKSANAVFVRPSLALKPSYEADIKESYGAEIFPLDDPARVNEWVRRRTNGQIDSLLSESQPPEADMLLLSALAFEAKWALPFDEKDTYNGRFQAPDGGVSVRTMYRKIEDANYAEIEDIQLLGLRYKGSKAYMLLALPMDGDIKRALAWLARTDVNSIRFRQESADRIVQDIIDSEKAKGRTVSKTDEAVIRWKYPGPMPWKVVLRLPKFDLCVENELKAPLEAQGVGAMFDRERADFSGMSDTPLYVDSVLQKLRVQVDEQSTRAAAVMEESFAALSVPPTTQFEQVWIKFTCDRPFIVLIVDGASGEIGFAGVVADPRG